MRISLVLVCVYFFLDYSIVIDLLGLVHAADALQKEADLAPPSSSRIESARNESIAAAIRPLVSSSFFVFIDF